MLKQIYGLHPSELHSLLHPRFPAYRVKQVLHWLYKQNITNVEQMTDLPGDLKDFLRTECDLSIPEIDALLTSTDGCKKFRLVLSDKLKIEMIMIPEGKKNTLCISSQVGCTRGCKFCATGTMKYRRNLETHEFVQQLLVASLNSNTRVTNIVFMGMGEPLDNLENVLKALQIFQHASTFGISPRRITLSTCGIIPGIYQLADSGVKVKLALSLNAAKDEIRSSLMPVNDKYPLSVVKKALRYYTGKNPYRVTLEYILIPDVNMTGADLKALRSFCGDLSCKINFIPYNQIDDLPYKSPSSREVESFLRHAQSIPQAVTVRRSKGTEICGACGQLAIGSAVHVRSKNEQN